MANYRDVIIFPKFKNIDVIENIRKDCDNLYGKIRPHITILFPLDDNISDIEFIKIIKTSLKDFPKFTVKFNGTSISDDNYIFLNCIEGNKEIIKMHDLLYKTYFTKHLKDIKYIPHITLGQIKNCNNTNIEEIKMMTNVFECIIDEVSIERIGENDESIILDIIKLK